MTAAPEAPARTYSLAEWDALEQRTGEKYEWHGGELIDWHDMAGASIPHNQIVSNLDFEVKSHFLTKTPPDCETYSSDLVIFIEAYDRYRYPDLSVICGNLEKSARMNRAAVNPTVLFEVTSPESDLRDRTDKAAEYRTLASLRYYVIVSQFAHEIEVHTLSDDPDRYSAQVFRGLEASAKLPELDLELSLAKIYRAVTLTPRPPAKDDEPRPPLIQAQ